MADLMQLSQQQLTAFLDSFDTVLTDCDGVLWLGNLPIPGSKDVILKLQALGKKVIFVSNNALLTADQYLTKFAQFGYKVTEEEIVIPSIVVCHYLKSINFQKKAYVLGGKAFHSTMCNAGFECVDLKPESQEWTLKNAIGHLNNLDSQVAAVVLDLNPHMNYMDLMQALELLKKDDCLFILGATDYDAPVTEDRIFLGPGYFADILQAASKRQPVIAGKPSKLVHEVVAQRHPLVPARTLFIGDSLDQDVAQGVMSDFQTLLVLSGVAKLQDVESTEFKPNYILSSLGALLSALEKP